MDSLTYREETRVYLGKRHIGTIRAVYAARNDFPSNRQPGNLGGYRYHPKGDRKGGEVFPTLNACKRSLETP